jgi:hypothetical protein
MLKITARTIAWATPLGRCRASPHTGTVKMTPIGCE